MKRALAFVALAACLAPAAFAGDSRSLDESFAYDPGQRVVLDFAVGHLEVEAYDGRQVKVEIEARCRWAVRRCEDRLADLRVLSRSSSRRLRIEVESPGSWSGSQLEIDAVIRVPRQAPLEIDMGVGELDVDGFENDVHIEMGVGEVAVRMAESAVRRVALDAGIGESRLRGAHARVRERRSLLIGSELSWDQGSGRAEIEVELGIGEISVELG